VAGPFQKSFWAAGVLCLGTLSCFGMGNEVSISPDDPKIQYSGRIDFTNPKLPRFDWPKVSITAEFSGKSVGILLKDGGNNYNVFVDGKLNQTIITKPEVERYDVKGLSSGSHLLRVVKRTEASWGIAVFKGLVLDKDGTLEEPPAPSKRRIEIIGDSLSCGYGNEGPGLECKELRPYQNSDQAYGAFLERDLSAEVRITAISGKGVVRNYGDKAKSSPDPMPSFYDRTLAGDVTLKWDFGQWIPGAFILFLGSNDFSTEPYPDQEFFVKAYKNLIQVVRKNYPKVQIFCIGRPDLSNMGTFVEDAVKAETAKGDLRINYISIPPFRQDELGCDWHPKVVAHRKLADYLLPTFEKTMKWEKMGD